MAFPSRGRVMDADAVKTCAVVTEHGVADIGGKSPRVIHDDGHRRDVIAGQRADRPIGADHHAMGTESSDDDVEIPVKI